VARAGAGAPGPRFSLLPPPPEGARLSVRHGAGQPGLASKVDAARDLRLAAATPEAAGAEGAAAEAAPPCRVPEPYLRMLRPDQRMRAVAVSRRHEPRQRALEREGLWF